VDFCPSRGPGASFTHRLCFGESRGGFNLPPLLMETDAFPDGGIVPLKYANAGGSTMPAFKISNAPAGTVAYAVIFHDIDVSLMGSTGDVLHWMAWDIPAASNGWPEGPSTGASLPAGSGNRRGAEHY